MTFDTKVKLNNRIEERQQYLRRII